jgi:hypothetical protein
MSDINGHNTSDESNTGRPNEADEEVEEVEEVEEFEHVDADIARITDYLSGALDIADELEIEDRLANDAAFLDKVQPVIDCWYLPTSFATAEERAIAQEIRQRRDAEGPSEAELDAAWNRYVLKQAGHAAEQAPSPSHSSHSAHTSQPEVAVVEVRPPAKLTVVRSSPVDRVRSAGRRAWREMPSMARQAASLAAGILILFGTLQMIVVPMNALDHGQHETATERAWGWFHRATVPRDEDTRRIEVGRGSVITLGPNSTLTFRDVERVPGQVFNVEGTAIIELSERGHEASLFTPAGVVILTPGRYVVRSVDEHSPMVVGVLAGSATVIARRTSARYPLAEGQYAKVVVGHKVELLPGRPPGLP